MILLGLDSETWPIRPGLQAPPVVCGQISTLRPEVFGGSPSPGQVLAAGDYRARLTAALSDGSTVIVGHNVAFDMLAAGATWPDLLPAIFEAYASDRITCTMIREKLGRIALGTADAIDKSEGGYSLLGCLERHEIPHHYRTEGGHKSEAWRTGYHRLIGIPISDWPADAIRYAREDAEAPLRLWAKQAEAFGRRGWLADEYRQSRASFMLSLVSARGFKVDPRSLAAFEGELARERPALVDRMRAGGVLRSNGTKDTKVAKARMVRACEALAFPVPLTDTGKDKVKEGMSHAEAVEAGYVSMTAEATELASAGDVQIDPVTGERHSVLGDWSKFVSLTTLTGRCARLRRSLGQSIQSRYDVLKATGRTSVRGATLKPGQEALAWGDQVQNPNRAPGVREAYVPRPGYLLASVDFGAAELHTFAQVCTDLGLRSRLAEVLRSGKDAHLAFGAAIRGWTYDWSKEHKNHPEFKALIKAARQGAKAANFGFPGGLGVEKFRLYAAATYGVILTVQEATELRDQWFAFYPEAREYFAIITRIVDAGIPLRHPRSDRFRGRVRFTSGCNSLFQGLAGDMAKHAGFQIARAMYVDRGSVLFGSRNVAFVHDEFLAEVPEDRASECAEEIARIMGEAGDVWTPVAPCRAEPALSRRWRKSAEPVRGSDGRLIAYEDRPITPHDVAEILDLKSKGKTDWAVSWIVGREVETVRQIAA